MSRGVIYTATFRDFLSGVFEVDVPQGYTRIQFNQFTAGSEKPTSWITKLDTPTILTNTGGPISVTQTSPLNKVWTERPQNSVILKAWCEGLDAQSPVIAAGRVGETIYLGMNGNPYKITNRSLRVYITNEVDTLVNNLGIILQYTFL